MPSFHGSQWIAPTPGTLSLTRVLPHGCPAEEIVKGAKVNFRTDITASFGQLVLVKTNNISSDGVPVTKQEYAIALGRVIGTTGAV
jgi:hypothetical protein